MTVERRFCGIQSVYRNLKRASILVFPIIFSISILESGAGTSGHSRMLSAIFRSSQDVCQEQEGGAYVSFLPFDCSRLGYFRPKQYARRSSMLTVYGLLSIISHCLAYMSAAANAPP